MDDFEFNVLEEMRSNQAEDIEQLKHYQVLMETLSKNIASRHALINKIESRKTSLNITWEDEKGMKSQLLNLVGKYVECIEYIKRLVDYPALKNSNPNPQKFLEYLGEGENE